MQCCTILALGSRDQVHAVVAVYCHTPAVEVDRCRLLLVAAVLCLQSTGMAVCCRLSSSVGAVRCHLSAVGAVGCHQQVAADD